MISGFKPLYLTSDPELLTCYSEKALCKQACKMFRGKNERGGLVC